MAAKFTKGDSEKTTRNVTAKNPPPNVRTTSHYLESGNTMSGMPGYIDADKGSSMDHVRGGPGVGPHREGPVGKRGSSVAKTMGKHGKGAGTMTPSYHKTATGRAGPIEHDTSSGHEHVHIRKTSHPMPGQKPPPTSKGKLGGTIRAAGIDRGHNERSKGFQAAIGHSGRMEKLSGRAKTHAEGRRKSVMY